jgi:hypothetical protein
MRRRMGMKVKVSFGDESSTIYHFPKADAANEFDRKVLRVHAVEKAQRDYPGLTVKAAYLEKVKK